MASATELVSLLNLVVRLVNRHSMNDVGRKRINNDGELMSAS